VEMGDADWATDALFSLWGRKDRLLKSGSNPNPLARLTFLNMAPPKQCLRHQIVAAA
jgi:hypothetical protein